ncbi:MAG: FkbM family methyltransferase [Flavobacteriales bacterium]|nr:FkbM family methyltransferase [Flavobacteriales bacterium]
MLLPKLLSALPFTVNVSGKKHDLICALGRAVQPLPNSFLLEGTPLNVKKHTKAHIMGYAGHNFLKNFRTSYLGQYMANNLAANDLFVDAGANLGGFSFMAKRMGAQVVAIEADPQLANFLAENENAFGKVLSLALSDEAGTSTFYISDENIGGNSLVMSSKGWESSGYSSKCEVKTARLDALGLAANGQRIKLLKIDVEGHEEAVVKGCAGLFSADAVETVWCEVRGPQSDRNPSSYLPVCEELAKYGFNAFTFDGTLHPFDWRNAQEVPQFFDLLFQK